MLLHEAELRRRRRERAETLLDMNMAFAGGKEADEHMRSLQTDGKE